MRKNILLLVSTLIIFWILYTVFQKDAIYHNSLEKVIAPYEQNNNWPQNIPITKYKSFSNNDFVQWDSKHYFNISQNGYNIDAAGGDYIFAFFPLFPALINILHLSPLATLFFNYILFSISILLLLKLLVPTKMQFKYLLIYLTFPFIIIFFVPYTEALYFFLLTITLYGFIKDKYWIFFIGMLLAATTRPSISILLLSLIATEVFFFIKDKKLLETLQKVFFITLPLIIGTVIVSVIQLYYGSKNIFKFIEVQKYWDNKLDVPHYLRDWSYEGFSINIGVIFLIFIPLLMVIFQLLIKQFSRKSDGEIFKSNIKTDYLLILSIIYIIGNTLFILLFRGGGLQCLFRFSLASPFFAILMFLGVNYIKEFALNYRVFVFGILSLFAIFTLALTPFSTYWHFSDMGLFIIITSMGLYFFNDLSENNIYKIILYSNFFVNIIWTTFLFNTFLTGRTLFL